MLDLSLPAGGVCLRGRAPQHILDEAADRVLRGLRVREAGPQGRLLVRPRLPVGECPLAVGQIGRGRVHAQRVVVERDDVVCGLGRVRQV